MTALTADRITARRVGAAHSDPVAASAILYVGALAVLDASGNLAPGTAATGLTARGVVQADVDNTGGAAGAVTAETVTGVFRFNNNAGDVTRAFIGKSAYIVDDNTVSSSSATSTRSVAGVIDDVDADGVWVAVGLVTGTGY